MEMDIEKKILRFATMTVAAACPAALSLDARTTAPCFSRNTSADWQGSRAAHPCIVSPPPSEQATELDVIGPDPGVSWVPEIYLWFGRLLGNPYFTLLVLPQATEVFTRIH